ncbi:MAG: hypothetical protein EHM68_07920 [Lysobacterales bacterium]|nr:MAG: hypothetical protein EHM68_07920 [Xanthomonadales bacterium]
MLNSTGSMKTVATCSAAVLLALAVYESAAGDSNKSAANVNENSFLSLLVPKTIFVTSDQYSGDLVTEAAALGFLGSNGLAAADFICQYHAGAAGLSGTYVAVLSSSMVNANARLTASLGPYRLTNGTPVSENFAALFSATFGSEFSTPPTPAISLISGIDHDEYGWDVDSPAPDHTRLVWTGSTPLGEVPLFHWSGQSNRSTCSDWTEDSYDGADQPQEECDASLNVEYCGLVGLSSSKGARWTDYWYARCDSTQHLYCAQK